MSQEWVLIQGNAPGFAPIPPFVGGTDPNWWQRFQLRGTNPNSVLDYQNGLYWDGTTTFTSPSTLMNNGTVTPGSGLLSNANNISLKGAALSGFQGGAYTVQIGTFGGSNGVFGGLVTSSPDGTSMGDQVIINNSGPLGTVKNPLSTPLTLNSSQTPDFTEQVYEALATTVAGGYRTLSVMSPFNALQSVTDANPFVANPFAIILGSLASLGDQFGGYIQFLAIMNSATPSSYDVLWPAFTGPNAWYYNQNAGAGISYGNILQYDYTQPWTVIAAIVVITNTGAGNLITGIIFSNVGTTSPYPGWEIWVHGSGKLRARLIFDFNTTLVDVEGSTVLSDGKQHVVAWTNTGSGTAAGQQFYVDGVAETMTTISDTLGGNHINLGANWFFVGNQSAAAPATIGTISPSFALPGSIGYFDISNTVRSLSYIQSVKINQLMPPVDANTVLRPKLSEGGSNTTTADQSSSGFLGTMSGSGQWLRG